jgi:thioredoxin-like negative regulator of GroEL
LLELIHRLLVGKWGVMAPAQPRDRTNRNAPCPCGSGKKYKKCCMIGSGNASSTPANTTVNVETMLGHAASHHADGRLEEAERLYRRVLVAEPSRTQAMVNLGKLREQIGDLEGSEVLFRKVVNSPDAVASHYVSLAALLRARGKIEEAIELVEQAIALEPDDVRAHMMHAEILRQMNNVDDARAVAERALAISPDDPGVNIFIADLDRQAGRLDEAAVRIEQLLATATEHEHRRRALKVLGTVLDRQGRYPEAFDAFVRGGIEGGQSDVVRHIDRTHWQKWIKGYKKHFTSELAQQWAAQQPDDGLDTPSFLVGFPRSGTTMTERILGVHPGIQTSDEQPFVRQMIITTAQMFDGASDIPMLLTRLDIDHRRKLRATYWEQVHEYVGSDLEGKMLVDKTPLNFMHLAMINAAFPDAKIIVALRDPRDVCLSCLMQRFALNTAMINLLTWQSTVSFYRQVLDLWLHQRDMITNPHLQVRYEDTVEDLEAQSRRMLQFLDLPWDECVLAFHETAANQFISTPSYAAVARPANRDAVGRWRNYEAQIADMVGPLDRYIDEFGYR